MDEDLKRLHKEKAFRKLPREKGETPYLIFPTLEEKDMEIYLSRYEEFNFLWYLEQCSKINAHVAGKDQVTGAKKGRQSKKNYSDPNYELGGYQEMKEEWMKKNAKKN